MTWLARLYLTEGVIEMARDWTWHALPDSPNAVETAAILTPLSLHARTKYSPADGYPGHRFAQEMGRKWHAKRVEFCPIPPSPPGVVH